jgi:Fe-S cluster assembly protein SufD
MSTTPKVNTQQIEPYLEGFRSFEQGLNGGADAPLHAIRKEAIAHFATTGFPTTRDEEWRFTSVAPIAGMKFRAPDGRAAASVSARDIDKATFAGLESNRLVFIDGQYAPNFSTVRPPAGGSIGSLAAAVASRDASVEAHLARHAAFRENPFTALNTGFLRDGAFIHVPDGAVWTDPVFILYVTTGAGAPAIMHPRNLIVAGAKSQCFIVERYCSLADAPDFTNAVTEVVVGEGAIVEHDKVQHESMSAYHVAATHVTLGGSSVYTSNAFSFGGAIVRNTITAVMHGEGIECTLNGLSLATGTQHVDNHTAIDHATPRCNSHELYKSILDGSSRGVFNGKIFVRQDAQKTDAKQTNKTLLLSDTAVIDTKPQLEIFADDVKCTHGATVGALDAESVFYLRSRGISADLARDILTYAFANDVTGRVKIEPVRVELERMLLARLAEGRQMAGI